MTDDELNRAGDLAKDGEAEYGTVTTWPVPPPLVPLIGREWTVK